MAYGYYELCIDIFKTVKKPLTSSEIWEYAKSLDFVSNLSKNTGATPDKTISAMIYTNMQSDNLNLLELAKNLLNFF